MKEQKPNYRRYRFPPEIISHSVWLYHRFTFSLRDIEDLLAERGIVVSYESIRRWCMTFGLDYARALRKHARRLGDAWYMDEVVLVMIGGRRQYLWRAVDQDRDVIDILVQSRKDRQAAKRFFRKLIKGQGGSPNRMVTDKLRSYGAAKRDLMPGVIHCQERYANNRAEVFHEHTRERERQMRRFKSPKQVQRFLSVYSQVHNLFRVGRHLLRAADYRFLRGRAFYTWQQVTCVR